MSTYTLFFCGTDCWPDESIINRKSGNGSDPNIYSPISGYIPSKLHHEMITNRKQYKAVIPGPGAPWYANWDELWVPSTIRAKGVGNRDSLSGESMWDLAGHAAARVVGVPSCGRGKWKAPKDEQKPLIDEVMQITGAQVHPIQGKKPATHECYRRDPEQLALLYQILNNPQYGPYRAETFNNRDRKVTKINMIGHSRGGVAAIMAAHELYYLFPDAKVNIFAIDPVPGTGPLKPEMMKLAPNVEHYVGVYALDETSAGFNAVVPRPLKNQRYIDPLAPTASDQRISLPKYHLLHVPGRHGTVAGNGTSNGKDGLTQEKTFSAVGELVNCLATSCLNSWGSNIVKSSGNATTLSQTIRKHSAKFRAMRNFTYIPFDTHSVQHWKEKGVTSSEGNHPSNWHYIEDAIGNQPLVSRTSNIPNMLRRSRPNPSLVKWESLYNGLPKKIIADGKWPKD